MTAIYARQSVEKADSISIETQIQTCIARLPRGEAYEVYEDRGYSGASNQRPALERMMERVRAGRITCIAVYKLDRLGRNLRHFLALLDELRSQDVTLMTESVTLGGTDAYGRLLAGLMMSFAELERDTIIRRVTDNYYERGRKGMFLGGTAPFGYIRTVYRADGKAIKGLTAHPETGGIVQELFGCYAQDDTVSLGSLAQRLNRREIKTVRGNPWSSATVGRLLHNPVYVRADEQVYRYFKARGTEITAAPAAFDGIHGLYLYGTAQGRTATKYADLSVLTVSVAPHEGLVNAECWLACQRRLAGNRAISGKRPATWLSGLIRCGCCGYACSVTGRGRAVRYLTCGGRKMGICSGNQSPLTAEELERTAERYLWEKAEALRRIPYRPTARLEELAKERSACLSAFREVSAVTAKALDEQLCALEREQASLIQLEADAEGCDRLLRAFPRLWDKMDVAARNEVARIFLREIRVETDTITLVER
ncbi:MAG: recombinase family protein [Butyricicoccaceae bacterium]